MKTAQTRFEGANPILRVNDMKAAVHYYVEVLGFINAEWGNEFFTCVRRDRASIYLCKDGQGHSGTWVWVGVEDAASVHAELQARGARVRHAPRNYPWALEFHLDDVDGNILRIGSDSAEDRPYDEWMD